MSTSLTVNDVSQHLQARGLSADLIDLTTAVFHLCDNARYSPGTLAIAQRTHLIDDAMGAIQQLEDSAKL